jgi:UDP-glucuronate decarboxylase
LDFEGAYSIPFFDPHGMTTMADAGTTRHVLVTVGAGFIGSHLCDRPLSLGQEVLCVDNFFTGRKDNIVHLSGSPYLEFLRHDICFPLYVEVDAI